MLLNQLTLMLFTKNSIVSFDAVPLFANANNVVSCWVTSNWVSLRNWSNFTTFCLMWLYFVRTWRFTLTLCHRTTEAKEGQIRVIRCEEIKDYEDCLNFRQVGKYSEKTHLKTEKTDWLENSNCYKRKSISVQ